MAKDNRVILGAVRVEGSVLRTGQEDELAAAVSPSELKRLMDKGVIEGDFVKAVKAKPAEAETAPPKEK